jgi:hypothetical protein
MAFRTPVSGPIGANRFTPNRVRLRLFPHVAEKSTYPVKVALTLKIDLGHFRDSFAPKPPGNPEKSCNLWLPIHINFCPERIAQATNWTVLYDWGVRERNGI